MEGDLDMPVYRDTDINSPNAAHADLVQGTFGITNILHKLSIELADIVKSHPILSTDEQLAMLDHLREHVDCELTVIHELLRPAEPDLARISGKLWLVGEALIGRNYEFELVENFQEVLRVDVASARLRRTQAWHACLKELSGIRTSRAMVEYAYALREYTNIGEAEDLFT